MSIPFAEEHIFREGVHRRDVHQDGRRDLQAGPDPGSALQMEGPQQGRGLGVALLWSY